MDNTKIEWCDSTWNPITGCYHGCEYCYAKKQTKRFEGWTYTPGKVRVNVSEDKTYIHPMKAYYGETAETQYGKIAEIIDPFLKEDGSKAPYPFGFMPTFHRYRLNAVQHWKKPRTIFVCSMADLFGKWVPDKWIEEVFAACEKAPQHTYIFLTKNPERYQELYCTQKLLVANNTWFGATATDEQQMKQAIGTFCFLPFGIHTFLSIEPILCNISWNDSWIEHIKHGVYPPVESVILGAETGNRKNKVIPQKEWISEIVSDCDNRGITVFMKNSLIPIVGKENMRREFPWK